MTDFDEPHDDNTTDEPEVKPVGSGDDRQDPRLRPADPAGTRPRVDPESLLPSSHEPLLASSPVADVDTDGVEIPLDEDDASSDLLPTRRLGGAPAVAAAAAEPSPHAGRFGFALGALLAIAAAGVAVAALVIGNNNNDNNNVVRGPAWSAWAPIKGAGSGPEQIASHVGPQYKLPNGRQLLLVTASSLSLDGVNLDVAEEPAKSPIKVINGDKTVLYRMCGLATQCSLPGAPSTKRGFLVNREALELALYTFQYTDANGVVVLYPPAIPKTKPGQALTAAQLAGAKATQGAAYFQRKQLAPRLDQPLTATLTPTTPSIATADTAPDAPTVKDMTQSVLWNFDLTAGNTQDTGYLVLKR